MSLCPTAFLGTDSHCKPTLAVTDRVTPIHVYMPSRAETQTLPASYRWNSMQTTTPVPDDACLLPFHYNPTRYHVLRHTGGPCMCMHTTCKHRRLTINVSAVAHHGPNAGGDFGGGSGAAGSPRSPPGAAQAGGAGAPAHIHPAPGNQSESASRKYQGVAAVRQTGPSPELLKGSEHPSA
jgi:hypothetical protein